MRPDSIRRPWWEALSHQWQHIPHTSQHSNTHGAAQKEALHNVTLIITSLNLGHLSLWLKDQTPPNGNGSVRKYSRDTPRFLMTPLCLSSTVKGRMEIKPSSPWSGASPSGYSWHTFVGTLEGSHSSFCWSGFLSGYPDPFVFSWPCDRLRGLTAILHSLLSFFLKKERDPRLTYAC